MQTLSELVLAKVLNPDTFRWVSCSCPWPLWCSAPEKSPSGKILASPQFESNNFRISDDDWSGGAWQEQVGACWGGIWHFAEWVNCCLTVWFLIFLGIWVIFWFFIKILNFVCLCSGQAWWCGQRGTSRAPTGKKFFENQSFEEALEDWSFTHLVDQVDILIRNRSGSYFAKVAAATRSLDSTRPVGILSALEHRQIFKYQPGLDWPWRYIKYINIKQRWPWWRMWVGTKTWQANILT